MQRRVLGIAFALVMASSGVDVRSQQSAQCVAISAAKTEVDFVYRYTASSGDVSESTMRWLQFTPTSSRLRTTRIGSKGPMVTTEETEHTIENDLLVMRVDTVTGTDEAGAFSSSMTYSPGLIVMPAFRACVGQTVTIPAVTQTTKSNQRTSTAPSDSGELKIIAVDEQVTVPAGTFSAVRFTRTLNKSRGTEVTEVWRSTQHGVTVKRVVTTPRTTATEVLLAIR